MSFNGNFSISQGTDISSFTLTDTSTGSDAGLTDRRIYLFHPDGTTLVPIGSTNAYIDWPIANSTITISLLDKDYALRIEVDWISSAPLAPPSTYTQTILYAFTSNSEDFYAGLTRMQASNPVLVNDNHFYDNKMKLRLFIEDALDAVANMNDVYLAQNCLNQAYDLIVNQQVNF